MNLPEKKTLLTEIGRCIRKARLHADKSQKEVAMDLNITPQAYGNMERGEADLCISRLIALSHLLNTTLFDLLPKELQTSKEKVYHPLTAV